MSPAHARRPSRHRAKHHIPSRRWPRRLLILANVAVATVLVSAGAVYGYVRYRIDSIRTVAAPHLTATAPGVKDRADGLAPENILLIGNETRAGLTNPGEIAQLGSPQRYSGALSDVIMILHLDPAKNAASILSIPRDLFVPMPPGSPVGPYQKVDAALNDGTKGPDNLIQTITADLGIPINHYVELEFDGFQNTVNAVGGINIDFPERVFDANSLLDVSTPGCVHLNGAQALALVRARHLQYAPPGNTAPRAAWPYDPESDLSRIDRDHTFLRVLTSTVESQGIANPFRLNAFLGAIISQLTIDPGLKNQLFSLATHYRHLNPAAVPETTLPVTQVGGAAGYVYRGVNIGDVDFPVQPTDNQVIAAWDSAALPAPVAPTSVQVENITSTSHLAATSAAALSADGLHIAGIGDAQVPATTSETLVQYPPGGLAQALAVTQKLAGAVMLDPNSSLPLGTITVEVGSTVAVVAPASPSTTLASPASGGPALVAVPTPGGQTPSPAADQLQPWDPRPC
jgi:LCP family protein required for cell wall assembly